MKIRNHALIMLISLSLVTTIKPGENKQAIIYVATSDNEIVEIERWKIDEMKTLLVLLEQQRKANSGHNPLPATMITSEELQLVSDALSYISVRDFTFFYRNLLKEDTEQLQQGQTVLSLENGKIRQLLTAAEQVQASGVSAFCLSHIIPSDVQKALLNPYFVEPIIAMMPVLHQTLEGHPDTVTMVAISPDNTKIISSSLGQENNLILWDFSNSQAITPQVLAGHPQSVNAVQFNSDGTKIISGSDGNENNLILWDITNPKAIVKQALQGHADSVNTVAFSPDGTKIISGSKGNQNNLLLWNISNPEAIKSHALVGHAQDVDKATFSPDGRKIVSSNADHQNNLIVWDITNPEAIVQRALQGNPERVNTIAFIDTTNIVSGSDGQQDNLIVWNISNLDAITQQILQGHEENVTTIAVSPDGTTFASGSWACEHNLILWTINDQGIITPHHLVGHSGSLCTVTFNADGTKIASGSWEQPDTNLIVWNIRNPKAITHQALVGHPQSILTIAFDHTDTKIISGCRDKRDNLILHKFVSRDEKKALLDCTTAQVRFIYQLCLATKQGFSVQLTSPYAKAMFMRLPSNIQTILKKRLHVKSKCPQEQEGNCVIF